MNLDDKLTNGALNDLTNNRFESIQNSNSKEILEKETYHTFVFSYNFNRMIETPGHSNAMNAEQNKSVMENEYLDEDSHSLVDLRELFQETVGVPHNTFATNDNVKSDAEDILNNQLESLETEIQEQAAEHEVEPQKEIEYDIESQTETEANDFKIKVSFISLKRKPMVYKHVIKKTKGLGVEVILLSDEENGVTNTHKHATKDVAIQNPEQFLPPVFSSEFGTINSSISTEDKNTNTSLHALLQSSFKQRQIELHQYRIAVEKKRLQLLDIKLKREYDEIVHDKILFEKELDQ